MHDALNVLENISLKRAERALGEGTAFVSKRIKAIKLSNKSEFRWRVTVTNIYVASTRQILITKRKCLEQIAVKDKRRWQ